MSTERAVEEKQKSKGVRILQRGTFQEHKMRSEAPLACLAPAIHHAYKHTRSQHEQLWGVRVCAHKRGSFSVKRDDLLTLQSFTAWSWLPNTFLAFYWKDHSWLAYTPKQFRNKAYSHKETNCKDVWTNGALTTHSPLRHMPLTMFVNIYLKSMRNREQNTYNALEHL